MSLLNCVRKESPIFTQNTKYSSWRRDFEAYISSTDPDMWIPLVERYERPVLEGTKIEKSRKSMTTKERKAFDDERKTLTTIQGSLSKEILLLFKHHNNAYDLWVALEKRCGGYKKEEETQHNSCVASENKVDSEPSSCASCINLTDKINRYREDNERLNSNIEQLNEINVMLRENDKVCEEKLKAIFEEKQELKAKNFDQQDEIGSYVEMLTLVKKQLADSQAEVLDLKQKLSNFSTSSLVFDEILKSQRTDTKSKAGLGFHHVPPPKDYLPMPSKDFIKHFVPFSSKEDTKSVNPSVNEQVKQAELVRPTFVKAEHKPPVSVEEVIEVEDIPEESTIKVEKMNVKPENFIITTENDECFKSKRKAKVDNGSLKVNNVKRDFKSKSSDNSQSPVKNLKKTRLVEKFKSNKYSTSTSSTLGTSTSTCSPKSACSTNVPINRPSVYYPPPKQFEGTHWNRSYVEKRSCFRCGQQGHIIRDCRLLSQDRFGKRMLRTSSFGNSFSKTFSRRSSHSPISSCASFSPKPMARVNNVVPSRTKVQQHNIVENKSSKPKQVWKSKSTINTSMKSSEFLKYHKLIDVMIMDDSGQPKTIKAWVSHKI